MDFLWPAWFRVSTPCFWSLSPAKDPVASSHGMYCILKAMSTASRMHYTHHLTTTTRRRRSKWSSLGASKASCLMLRGHNKHLSTGMGCIGTNGLECSCCCPIAKHGSRYSPMHQNGNCNEIMIKCFHVEPTMGKVSTPVFYPNTIVHPNSRVRNRIPRDI